MAGTDVRAHEGNIFELRDFLMLSELLEHLLAGRCGLTCETRLVYLKVNCLDKRDERLYIVKADNTHRHKSCLISCNF